MKVVTFITSCTLAFIITTSSNTNAQTQDKIAAERIQTLLREVVQETNERDFEKAIKYCDTVLADSEATLKQKVEAISRKATVFRIQNNPEAAVALYSEALEGTEFQSVPERANLLLNLAQYWNTLKNPDKAQAVFEQAADFVQATRPDHLAALRGIGESFLAQNQYELARKSYARIFDLPELTAKERSDAQLLVADAYEQEGDFAKAEAEFKKATKVADLTPSQRKSPLIALAKFYTNRNNWEDFIKTFEEIHAIDGNVGMATMLNRAYLANALGKKAEEEKAWDEIIALPNLNPNTLAKPIDEKLILLAARGDVNQLKTFLSDIENKTLIPEQRAKLTLLSAILAVPANDFSKFNTPAFESLDAEKQAQVYFDAGKIMMYLRDFEAARFLAQKGVSFFAKQPERLYEVPFMEEAPRGVSGWLHSPLIKDASYREDHFEEYNKQAAALLINDVNTARNVVTDTTAKKAPVAFYMAADAQGWHVFIEYKDEKAEEVLAGLAPGGSLEIYMVPGMSNPYYQLLLEVPSGQLQFIDWSSPNRHYRSADGYVISEITPIPGGFGISLIFPWELIYDKLPTANDTWPFGLVNFGRNGAFTWGSGQVHELSRFGKVKFPGIDKALPAIHRWIVLRAFAKYKASIENTKIVWGDSEKGDPDFFKTIVQPEIDRLSESGKSVNSKLSASDSEKLFQETVPAWMEFDYWVADQRVRYLTNQLMTGSTKEEK